MFQPTTRHGIAYIFFSTHPENYDQHVVSRHHRSRANDINRTTGRATHLTLKCNNSKDSCINFHFVWWQSIVWKGYREADTAWFKTLEQEICTRLDMEHIVIHNETIQMIHAGIILLPLPVAYAARTRQRTNKHSNYSCISRPRDMALHTCFSQRVLHCFEKTPPRSPPLRNGIRWKSE